MTYPGLNLFLEKLKRLIYGNDNPQVSSLLSTRPQLHLLYEELESMIQTLFVEKGNNLDKHEQVRNMKRRFKDVAEEAHDMLDLFVLDTNFYSENQLFNRKYYIVDFPLVLIEDVMRSIKSIKEDYFSILHNMIKMESSPRTDSLKTQSIAAGFTSSSRNSQVWDEIVVGLDRDIDVIRDKLCQDTRNLEIVSIVGMGGSGKTTLATKVFNDSFVGYHFKIRGWVTVSQTYEKTVLLNQILGSLGVEIELDKRDNYSNLRGKLHKCLIGKRFLIVIDDIWNTEAWDVLKVVFPNNNTGSRLLLTSRNKTVALHAKPHGFIHQLRCLTDEESWELLHKKVFHDNDFPQWLTAIGMQIARNCHGLPLAVVVIAGVLAKEPLIKDSWERISRSVSSLIVQGHMKTLALSLNHLPSHLRNCFLYLGSFPEDYKFQVTRLIWLWIAEGFIQEAENQSLEETAKDYLIELVDRNLVVVQDRKFGRAIKTFSVHDVLRELSSETAAKERFNIAVLVWKNHIIAPYKTSRLFMSPYAIFRPLCSFYEYKYSYESYIVLKCSRSWRLLTVLDLKECYLKYFPKEISLLVNLRYLAIRNDYGDFQYRICDLRNLQTLIIGGVSDYPNLLFPNTISNLVNLRHLQCHRAIVFPPLQMSFMNLQTISNVEMGHEPTSWLNYFPGVKKLSCSIYGDRKYDFKSLTFLEILKISCLEFESIPRFKKKNMITFPASLKKLTLKGCYLPWSNMSNIQSLPNLEVLKLLKDAFMGPQWYTGEEPFQELKFLKLSCLDIQQWEASSINFPCLTQLVLYDCYSLEGIPLGMRHIPTLEDIQITGCNNSIIQSAYEIQEEQHADGNYDLKIRVERAPLTTLMHYWLYKIFDYIGGSDIKISTGTSLNLLTPNELERLGLPINDPLAHQHIHRSRISNNGRSKNRPIKRKILKGGGRIRLFQ